MTMPELHWTEVDGVPVVWAEARTPLMAQLLFRTGRADETLATAGRTHLVEHLVLSAVGGVAERQNGYVAATCTGFVTVGRPEEVSAFLRGVCRALGELPGDRLAAERRVLEAEAAQRSDELAGRLLMRRFGATGYGLVGLPEYGLAGATIAELRALAAQRFTVGSAILWLSGPPPADLRLELPAGPRAPLPPLVPVLSELPAWFVDRRSGGVGVGAPVPRVAPAPLFCALANERLRAHLRAERAVSYAPAVGYEPLTADTAHLVLFADSDPDRREELAEAFGEVIEGLAEVGEDELERVRREVLESWTGSLAPPPEERALRELVRTTFDWILGRDPEPLEQHVAEYEAVSTADVAAFAREFQGGALVALPGTARPKPWMGSYALPVLAAVDGPERASVDAPIRDDRLVHGPDGVTLRFDDGSRVTVRYDGLAAALAYDDGGVVLVGLDAQFIRVEPTLWRDGPAVGREIRARVPAHLLLAQGAREGEEIPQAETTAWQRLHARARAAAPKLGVGALVVLGLSLAAAAPEAAVAALKFLGPLSVVVWALSRQR